MELDQALTTTRTVRKRLDLSRPVERSIVEECLSLALQAPNGSNRQLWRWILVDDPGVRAERGRTGRQARVQRAERLQRGRVARGDDVLREHVDRQVRAGLQRPASSHRPASTASEVEPPAIASGATPTVATAQSGPYSRPGALR